MKFPPEWSKKRKARFIEGVKEGQHLAKVGDAFPEKHKNAPTAFASGLRVGYSKRRQRLNAGHKPQELTGKLDKPRRVRHNSVLVKYDAGDTYHITNVRNFSPHDDDNSVSVTARLKDGTTVLHVIPLHNKDVVSYYGPKPQPKLLVVKGSDPEFLVVDRRKK